MNVKAVGDARARMAERAYALVSSQSWETFTSFIDNYLQTLEYELVNTSEFDKFQDLKRRQSAIQEVAVIIKMGAAQYERELKAKASENKDQGASE